MFNAVSGNRSYGVISSTANKVSASTAFGYPNTLLGYPNQNMFCAML
jgi:hypothetical protein